MLKTNLKLIIASLVRRKWFTLLMLFSIAISLVVVISIAAFGSMLIFSKKPEVFKERTFYMHMEFSEKENGKVIPYYKTAFFVPPEFYSQMNEKVSVAENITWFTYKTTFNIVRSNRGEDFFCRYTDGKFFSVFKFEFTEGEPYSEKNLRETREFVVISEKIANHFFGTSCCIGETIKIHGIDTYITGVFKQSSHITPVLSDMYLYEKELTYHFDNNLALLCSSMKDRELLSGELNKLANKMSLGNDNWNLQLSIKSSFEEMMINQYRANTPKKMKHFALVILSLMLPYFGLGDLLRSRLKERMVEAGLRRAFGASFRKVLGFLLLESSFVTILGGVLGIFMSFFFYKIVSGQKIADLAGDFFYWKAVVSYVVVFMIVGCVSGLIPAYQLSRNGIVKALNNKV